VSTTAEYLKSFKLYSEYDVRYLHVTQDADVSEVNFDEFDAIFHSYCARLCYPGYVSPSYIQALKNFRGARVLAVQDEYDQTNALRQAIRELEFHAVLTCVPQDSIEFVYPRAMFPDTEFITVLTGYVPSSFSKQRARSIPLARRPIVVGYRGRDIGGRYGRLGFDKLEIGRRMRQICEERGIPHNIETTEDKRIYGEAWYNFLGSCRVTLGTESGSNIFDFDGKLQSTYQELKGARGENISFEEFRQYTDPLEGCIQMGQLSPRVFEAAMTRTPMVLFTGRYSDAIAPGDHYIELKKDFSNIDGVVAQISDVCGLEKLADRAHAHLIVSGKYEYRGFVQTVEDVINGILDRIKFRRPMLEIPRWREFDASQEKEWPTAIPQDPLFGQCKRLNKELDFLRAEFLSETGRLIKHIGELNAVIGELRRPSSLSKRVAKAIISRLRPRSIAKVIASRLRHRRIWRYHN
jgi:hypothetical protein